MLVDNRNPVLLIGEIAFPTSFPEHKASKVIAGLDEDLQALTSGALSFLRGIDMSGTFLDLTFISRVEWLPDAFGVAAIQDLRSRIVHDFLF